MSRETYLLSNENPWAKSGEKSKFDVQICSCDGAEVCPLIMLNKIKSLENSKRNPLSGAYRK